MKKTTTNKKKGESEIQKPDLWEGMPPYTRDDSTTNWTRVLVFFAILGIILCLVIVFVSLFRSSRAENVTRFCFSARPEAVVPPLSGTGWLDGSVTLDTSSDSISYDAFRGLNTSVIMSIWIMGPRVAGEDNGPELFALCGVDVPCILPDPESAYWLHRSGITQVYPGPRNASPIIRQIRARPHPDYYIEVRTAEYPDSPGGLRAPLDRTCGFAI
jgi:hypothetical protein